MQRNMRPRFASVILLTVAACGPSAADRKAEAQVAARTAVSAESTRAAVAAAAPSTGKWDEAHLVERLVRSGLAPQAVEHPRREASWGAPVLAWHVANATLYAYIYPDSTARRRALSALDTLTLAPAGAASPWPDPHILIVQNNLAAVLVGGSDRQQERVSLALTAGLASSR
jgi:hypothetical protein